MRRFDSEIELESHALGRSLLLLVRDGDSDAGLEHLSRRTHIVAPANPFDALRARLATVDIAIRGLHAQVQFTIGFYRTCELVNNNKLALRVTCSLCSCL